MSKYSIEKKDDEVIFREITFNTEEYGDDLVELTEDELDQQLEEYSNQDLYVSVYHQVQTVRHGIQFTRKRFTTDVLEGQKYKLKPVEEDVNLEGAYYIKERLTDIEVLDFNEYITESKILPQYLTKAEFVAKVKSSLKMGLKVYFGYYEYKWKKWRFKPEKVVKEVTEDGQILYR